MATALNNLSNYDPSKLPGGEKLRIGVVTAEWNEHITYPLRDGAIETLEKHGVRRENIFSAQVPGSYELTSGADMLLSTGEVDAVICLGCVIKGETRHDEYINSAVSIGLTQLGIGYHRPVIFGLLTCETEQQAIDRAGGKHGNKGVEAAVTALRMVGLKKQIQSPGDGSIGFRRSS